MIIRDIEKEAFEGGRDEGYEYYLTYDDLTEFLALQLKCKMLYTKYIKTSQVVDADAGKLRFLHQLKPLKNNNQFFTFQTIGRKVDAKMYVEEEQRKKINVFVRSLNGKNQGQHAFTRINQEIHLTKSQFYSDEGSLNPYDEQYARNSLKKINKATADLSNIDPFVVKHYTFCFRNLYGLHGIKLTEDIFKKVHDMMTTQTKEDKNMLLNLESTQANQNVKTSEEFRTTTKS